VHDFLAIRRARITPEQAGMPRYGEKRRVPGCGVKRSPRWRRELRLLRPARAWEPVGVSNSVLEGLARALQLDEAECQHLFDLAKAASVPMSRSRPAKLPVTRVRPPY
jgi:hypothetical protein